MKCDATMRNVTKVFDRRTWPLERQRQRSRVALATDIQFQRIVLGQTSFVRADSRRCLFGGARRIMIGWNWEYRDVSSRSDVAYLDMKLDMSETAALTARLRRRDQAWWALDTRRSTGRGIAERKLKGTLMPHDKNRRGEICYCYNSDVLLMVPWI